MRRVILTTLVLLAGTFFMSASRGAKNDPVLLRVGDRTIARSEFEAIYRKNNLEMQVADPKSVEDYLELYINFNLKVVEAISLGMDTNPDFLSELKGYRDQLAKPYFNDQEVAEQVIAEAYNRMQYDIRASHILIRLEGDATPADSIEAYRKINQLRERALAGESFNDLAQTYSEDMSARDTPAEDGRPARKGNKGDLGYFTVFNMVYPFETAAFNTPDGEISKPIRSDFGYHIIKVEEKLPAMGTARVAHIMLMTPPDASEEDHAEAERKIRELHQRYLAGEDFAELAKTYSEDRSSAERGGEMQPFTSSRMVQEFISQISKMEAEGEVSPPVQSAFGWHIIKLIEKTPPGSYEDEYAGMSSRANRDVRSQLSKKAVVERLKKEYRFRENLSNVKPFFEIVDTTVFQAAWQLQSPFKPDKRLFRFASKTYTQNDFAEYLMKSQALRSPQSMVSYLTNMYRSFVEEKILEYEDARLEGKYPEFRRLMREYHDGILLFELTDQKIWSRALTDTLGLAQYYEANKYNYMGEETLKAAVYVFQDLDAVTSAREIIREMIINGMEDEAILENLLETTEIQVDLRQADFIRGKQPAFDEITWSPGLRGPVFYDNEYLLVRVFEKLPPGPKKMEEIRGLLIADYQQYLEDRWVEELKNRYEVFVDRNVLRQVQLAIE